MSGARKRLAIVGKAEGATSAAWFAGAALLCADAPSRKRDTPSTSWPACSAMFCAVAADSPTSGGILLGHAVHLNHGVAHLLDSRKLLARGRGYLAHDRLDVHHGGDDLLHVPLVQMAIDPLVARLAADAIVSAQFVIEPRRLR